MNTFHRYCLAICFAAAMFAEPSAFAAGSICYGDLTDTGICKPPDTLTVQQADVIELPGVLWAHGDADEDRLAISVALRDGTFARTPQIEGGTISTSTPQLLLAAGDGVFALRSLAVRGAFRPDSDIVAHVRLVDPNVPSTLWEGDIVLAHVAPVSSGALYMLNPAGNTEQQTFVRVTNTGTRTALIVIRPIDDTGATGGEVSLFVGPGASRQLTAVDLERGALEKNVFGGFGTGTGKWRATYAADQPTCVQVLVRGADGSLSALSDTACN